MRYLRPDYDDPGYLSPYPKSARPNYPGQSSPKFKVGKRLNKILRHYIGQVASYETGKRVIKCNEGGWVLLEDLLKLDFIWKDRRSYEWEERKNYARFLDTRNSRISVIIERTVAESRLKGKTRFQIMGLKAEDQADIDEIIRHHRFEPPTAMTSPFEDPYNGWKEFSFEWGF